MSWSGLAKFFLGLFLAIGLLVGGGVLAARYFIAKFTAPPPRPVFANDKPTSPPPKATDPKVTASPAAASPTPATPSPKPLEPGAYPARVTQPIGLILRDNPGRDGARVGGLDFNARVIVLESSPDKEWQKVRLQGSDREGWVKAGNTERVSQ